MAKISKIFTFIKVGSVLGTPKTPEGGSKCWSSKYTIERASQVFLCGGGKKGRCDLLLWLPCLNQIARLSIWKFGFPCCTLTHSNGKHLLTPTIRKKRKKEKKKLLVIRSGCVELSKRRKLRLIIISKLTGLRVIQTFTASLKSKIFYQAVDLKGLFSEK